LPADSRLAGTHQADEEYIVRGIHASILAAPTCSNAIRPVRRAAPGPGGRGGPQAA
jgi:hypothetical protein